MVWKELNYGQMREKEKQLVVSEVSSALARGAARGKRAAQRARRRAAARRDPTLTCNLHAPAPLRCR